jgi:hypothetical protein
MIDRQTASGLQSALRIITGTTADEFAAPGAPLLPSAMRPRRGRCELGG